MNLCHCRKSIRQLYASNPLLLAPVAEPVLTPQQSNISNAVALGDGFNVDDLADDFQLHQSVPRLAKLSHFNP
jgi:hypothetical protein